jgi:hypothetical protein
MATYRAATSFVPQFVDANGVPLSGGTISAFLAGTTTATSMFSDNAGTSAGAIVTLNALGSPEVSSNTVLLWVNADIDYKFVLKDSLGVSIWTVDDLSYTPSSDPYRFATVASMVAATTLSVGNIVETAGYYAAADGGGNQYVIVAAATGTADGGRYINLASHQAQGVFPAGVNILQFGAKGDGTYNDTTAIVNADTFGSPIYLPLPSTSYKFDPATTITAPITMDASGSWAVMTDSGDLVYEKGFFTDESGANVDRVKDRLFVGNAANYSGNRQGVNGYGDSWTTAKGGSYLIKNAAMAIAAEEISFGLPRYGLVAFSKSMGIGAIAVNDGVDTFARGLYAEVFHQSDAGASTGIEIQTGNYTDVTPAATAYDMTLVTVTGLQIGAVGGEGYTVGDGDTPITPAGKPSGCAIDIASGAALLSHQTYVTGIVFRDSALVRDVDGFGTAASLARKHQIRWEASAAGIGANIWSENANPAAPVGIKFEASQVNFVGVSNRYVLKTFDDSAGSGAVNWPLIKNSRTGVPISISVEGADTNIDLQFITKGTGVVRFGTWTTSVDAAVNGYVTIRDAGGTTRKLATIA